ASSTPTHPPPREARRSAASPCPSSACCPAGRGRGSRTPNLRFWRPTLCQLSYAPVLVLRKKLFDDFGDDAGADGFAALADGEAKALCHGDGCDERRHHLHVVPGHHHLGALGQFNRAGHVRGAEVELGAVVIEEGGVSATFLLGEDVHLALELGVRGDRAG